MNIKQEMEDFGFSDEEVRGYTEDHDWYIRYASLEYGCKHTWNFGNIHEENPKTFLGFARAWERISNDDTKRITGWTGCNRGGY